MKRKLDQVAQLGCKAFALLFDDIEAEMSKPDKEAFQSFAAAQVIPVIALMVGADIEGVVNDVGNPTDQWSPCNQWPPCIDNKYIAKEFTGVGD